MIKKALEGIVVLDMSLAEAGPVSTETLSLLGATVYHIDRPGDTSVGARYRGHILRNLNKKSITLDAKSPEGKELMWQLIDKADVFFENFAPGAWDRMGFSYEEVSKRNPGIIYVSLNGFANDSRWGDCIAYDPVASCMGGSAYLSGYENRDPMLCLVNVADSGTGIHTGLTILLAILQKKLTGRGQYIEAPMDTAVVCLCRSGFAEYYANGSCKRHGNSYHGLEPAAPHNLYPTKESSDPSGDYIAIACITDEDFKNLCSAIDRPDLFAEPRYSTPELRFENREELDAIIREWTIKYNKYDAMEILARQHRVPAGAVQSIHELLQEKSLHETIFRDVTDTKCSDMALPLIPVRMSQSPFEPVISPGPPGTHNEEVYKTLLGISDDYYTELRAKKVI